MIFDIIIPVYQTKNILQLFYESLIATITMQSNIIFIDDKSPSETYNF